MKILLITVAGLSSRFSESLGSSCIKCLYHKKDFRESLLYRMLHHSVAFDKYIIVGGYKFEELSEAVESWFPEFLDRIILVENEKFSDYGSGYSLYLGLRAAQSIPYEELIFAEGDLFVDDESFCRVYASQKSVITCNHEAIWADKAVVFYYDRAGGIHYLYDTNHNALEIREPFTGIFNSGQIWKFHDKNLLERAMNRLSESDWQGTNLRLVQEYFKELQTEEYETISFVEWINCNTVFDFERI